MKPPVKLVLEGVGAGCGGIYRIVHAESGKGYVGSAVNIRRRWYKHLSELRHKRHASRHLQSAWEKYGAEAFRFECLEIVPEKKRLIEREQYWLDHYRVYNKENGYNSRTVAHSNVGHIASVETRAKLSKAGLGRKVSLETREKIRLTRLATERQRPPLTEEQRDLRSKAHKGIKCSPEARERMRQGQLKRAPFTAEVRRNISLSLMGRTHSEATREAISLGHTGIKASIETRAKMTAAQQKRRFHEARAS